MSNKKLLKIFFCSMFFTCCIIFFALNTRASSKTLNEYLTEIKKINPNHIDSILSSVNEALIQFKQEKDNFSIYQINAEMSILFSRHSYFSLSEKYSLGALNASLKLKEKKYQVKALNSYGVLWGRKGNLKDAEIYFLKALLLATKIKYREGIASSYLKLGVLRIKTNQPNEALYFLNKIDSLNNLDKAQYFLHDELGNKGIVFAMQGKLDTALTIFNLSYDDAIKRKNVEEQVSALQNIGLVYKEMGDLSKAETIFNKGIAIAKKNHLEENKLRIAINVAQLYLIQNKLNTALVYSENLLKEATDLELEGVQIEIRESIIEIEKKQNNLKEVVKQLEALDDLKNKQYKEEKDKSIAEAFAQLEFYKVQEKMEFNNDLLFETTKERNVMLIISLIVGLLLIGLIFSYINIKKLNRKLNRNKIQLTESNNNKNKLFTIIGHDLRSAYSSTLGVLGLIKTGDLENDEQEKYLDIVINQSESALATLDDLLLWGNALIKGGRLNKAKLFAKDAVDKNIEFCKDKLAAKNISIENEIPENCAIIIDANHFSFIIRNLIANAIKFTPEKGRIKITASNYQKNQIKISVTDNGVGIAHDKIESIFSPESKSTRGTNNEKGTGLGLTLCKEFVEANGGNIWAQNNIDEGASISFSCKKG